MTLLQCLIARLLAAGLVAGFLITAVQAAPFAYIPNRDSASVSVIDTATQAVIATIALPDASPQGVAVSRDGSQVYISSTQGRNEVYAIDPMTNTVTGTITVGNVGTFLGSAAITPDGAQVFVTNHPGNTVYVIDTASNIVTDTISVSGGPHGVVATPDGSRMYVSCIASGRVVVIDTATHVITANIAIDQPSIATSFKAATLERLPFATGPAAPSDIPVGSAPVGIAITPDGQFVYVANFNSSSVSVIATNDDTAVATIALGDHPQMVAISPDGQFAYVAHETAHLISVIATADNTVVSTINGFDRPLGLMVTPDGQHLYVSNLGNAHVSVVDTGTHTITGSPIPVGNTPLPFGIFIAEGPISTSTELTSDTNPSVFGQSIGLTATVDSPGSLSGSVSFFNGADPIAGCDNLPLNSADEAVCSTSALDAGSHGISAQYSGDATTAASTSATLTQVVEQATQTIIDFAADPAAPAFSAGGSFTVSAAGGASGNPVTFSIDAGSATICSVSGNTVTTLAAGTCTVLADQAGNTNYSAAAQVSLPVAIAPASTNVSLSTSPNPSVVNQSVTLSANVSGVYPTGILSFLDGTNPITGCDNLVLNQAGEASCNTSTLAVGSHPISAHYDGDTNNAASVSATVTHVVNLIPQTIDDFNPPGNQQLSAAPLTFNPTASSGLPVTLVSDTPSVCTVSGSGPFTVTLIAAGTCTLTADQAGDASHEPTSQTLSFGVLAAVPTTVPINGWPMRFALLIGLLLMAGVVHRRRNLFNGSR